MISGNDNMGQVKRTYKHCESTALPAFDNPEVRLVALENLRLRLTDRSDCDSARSRERKDRNSDVSRLGWSVK